MSKPHRLTKPEPIDIPAMEETVLTQWRKDQTFQKSVDQRPTTNSFTFYDGPPFATGLPHYGGLLQSTIKDIVPRYKTMQGYRVERRFGWDCHGLPVELEYEKEHGLMTRQEILAMGVDKYNDGCRAIVLRYTKEWEKIITRLGRWVDFENDYRTMDPKYMESIWWVVKQLHEQNLLYEGRRSMHICPRCATPLSQYEVSLGYADRTDPSVYVKFPLIDQPGTSMLAWTTTPWTLPGNTLIAINPELEYVKVEQAGEQLILAKNRLAETFETRPYKVLESVPAKALIGQKYEPPFPVANLEGKHYEVVAANFVTDTDGTGVAHEAPAFGEEDMALAKSIGAAMIQHIDITGHFIDPFPRYHDKMALEGNELIIAEVKEMGRLFRQQKIHHSYPHCWRCDTPLLNYATSSWFVRVNDFKDRLLKNNQSINWVPSHVKEGRFGKWLEGARDWSISRNRFWGNPLPIWRCNADPEHMVIVGSLDELEQLSGQRPTDLHKQFVDPITFSCAECDGEMHRIEEVLDCWFESGSMPYAKEHYPFEHQEEFTQSFPADFVVEGLDQTRGWFYTLHVLGSALFDSNAFKNVILTGLIMAEDGQKMSKRKKNYPDPNTIIDQYGSDALRLYMINSPLARGENFSFSKQGVTEVYRNFSQTLLNTYSFLATYADIDQWEVSPPPTKPTNLLDRWLLSRLNSLVADTTAKLDAYDLMMAARDLQEFTNELSNWYVRRNRRRFWKNDDLVDKAEAYAILHHTLTTLSQLTAPFTPFIADHLYQQLTSEGSVHLTDWPTADRKLIDATLERQVAGVRELVSLGLAARSRAGIKVRQPLSVAKVVDHQNLGLDDHPELLEMIKEELNVKDIELVAGAADFVDSVVIPDPRMLGPKFGQGTQQVINKLKAGNYLVVDGGYQVGDKLVPEDCVSIQYHPGEAYMVESSPTAVVGLETKITDELKSEGLVREVVRQIQEARKSAGLAVEDRISLSLLTTEPELERALDTHQDLIKEEVLASSLELGSQTDQNVSKADIDGYQLIISFHVSK